MTFLFFSLYTYLPIIVFIKLDNSRILGEKVYLQQKEKNLNKVEGHL